MNRSPARYNITEYCPDVRLLFDPAAALVYGGLFLGVAAIFSSRSVYHHEPPPLPSLGKQQLSKTTVSRAKRSSSYLPPHSWYVTSIACMTHCMRGGTLRLIHSPSSWL